MANEPKQNNPTVAAEYTGRKLRIGMVGAGGIANTHLEAYASVPAAEIAAICDIDEDRLNLTADTFHLEKRYTSIEDMIANEQLDAVDVCVWNVNHAKCSIYALEHGLNVLCEKPMAMNAAEAEAMKAAAEKAGKLLMIGFVLRFSDETSIMLDYQQDLGEIYYAKATYLRRHGAPGGWFCDKSRAGGGPVLDLGVHVLDQTRYLMGSPRPISVFASVSDRIGFRPELKNKVGWTPMASRFDTGIMDVEDFGTALIRYDNGAVVHLETSYSFNGESVTSKALYGTKGGVTITDQGLRIYTTLHDRFADITPMATGQTDPMFVNEMSHFVDCCLNGTPCRATADDGITVMKILDAVYESGRTGHEVILK